MFAGCRGVYDSSHVNGWFSGGPGGLGTSGKSSIHIVNGRFSGGPRGLGTSRKPPIHMRRVINPPAKNREKRTLNGNGHR
jgi:hypothetical protein